MKMNLQLFAEAAKPVQGKKIVYLYRLLSDAKTAAASNMAFVKENARTKSKDADTTTTKDGTLRVPGAVETEITATSLIKVGDPLINKLEDAMDTDELIEIWEANLADPAVGVGVGTKFKGMYFQGYITELEISSDSEDYAEVSMTFAINGSGKRGEVTVTAEQQELADYVFKDTVKEGE